MRKCSLLTSPYKPEQPDPHIVHRHSLELRKMDWIFSESDIRGGKPLWSTNRDHTPDCYETKAKLKTWG